MARGVVPDSSPYCMNAARSLALSQSDVVLVLGNPLNWQLHFGEPPKWSEDVKFILLDSHLSETDANKSHISAACSIKLAVDSLSKQKYDATKCCCEWIQELTAKRSSAKEKMATRLAKTAFPMNYSTALRIVKEAVSATVPSPVVISEGANTMDQSRFVKCVDSNCLPIVKDEYPLFVLQDPA